MFLVYNLFDNELDQGIIKGNVYTWSEENWSKIIWCAKTYMCCTTLYRKEHVSGRFELYHAGDPSSLTSYGYLLINLWTTIMITFYLASMYSFLRINSEWWLSTYSYPYSRPVTMTGPLFVALVLLDLLPFASSLLKWCNWCSHPLHFQQSAVT